MCNDTIQVIKSHFIISVVRNPYERKARPVPLKYEKGPPIDKSPPPLKNQ